MKILSSAVYKLRQSIKASLNSVDDVVSATAPKPQITIKGTKSKVTIKSVTHPTSGQVSSADILAEQNKATLVNQRSVSRQVDNVRTSSAEVPRQIAIKEILLPEKCFKIFQDLCNKNHGAISQADVKMLQKTFFDETGLNLHCSGNVESFNIMLTTIVNEVRAGRFPKEIKHIMIGHGIGNIYNKTWSTADGPVFQFIKRNNEIKKGDLILVGCCEQRGQRILGKPAYGREVELDLDIVRTNRGPAKIVRAGDEELCGHYSINDGLVLYN